MKNYLLAATVPEKFSTKTNQKKMEKMGMEGRKMDRFSVTDIILLYLKRKKMQTGMSLVPLETCYPSKSSSQNYFYLFL